jgi:hypothetical protein
MQQDTFHLGLWVELGVKTTRQFRQPCFIGQIYAQLQRFKANQTIQRTAVQQVPPKPGRHAATNGALAGAARTIDCDDRYFSHPIPH